MKSMCIRTPQAIRRALQLSGRVNYDVLISHEYNYNILWG